MKQLSVIAVLTLIASCASTEELKPRKLPFHIAVIPMSPPVIGGVSRGELPGEPTEMVLELESSEVTAAVSQALEQYCFSTVTVLEHEDLDGTVDAFERERIVLERAREAGADLVVELKLRYDPEVYRENANTFWLNFPLFLFAGPTNWFISDNSYFADVELTTSMYDLNVIDAGAFQVGDNAARIIDASSRYSGTDLDFIDRSDGVGDYVLGFVWPSGYLSRQSASTAEELHDKVIEELKIQVVQGIQSRRRELVRAEYIAPIFVEPAEIRITNETGGVLVEGQVRRRRDSLADRVHEISLNAGADTVTAYPVAVQDDSDPDYDLVSFEAHVPRGENASRLRIECEAGSRDRYLRSYTFMLPRE